MDISFKRLFVSELVLFGRAGAASVTGMRQVACDNLSTLRSALTVTPPRT
jgi:hypothetical protein